MLGFASQHHGQVVGDGHATSRGRTVERHDVIVGTLRTTQDLPKLHGGLGRHSYKVVREVLDLRLGQDRTEHLGGVHLVHQSDVLDGAEVSGLLDVAVDEDVVDSDLTVVVLGEVAEGDSTFEPDEARGENEQGLKDSARVREHTCGGEGVGETLPRPTRGVDLVGLVLADVLQVPPVVVDEVPDEGVHVVLRPHEPVLDGRLDIDNPPAVKLGGVKLTDLILRAALLATVDGSDDERVGVQVATVNLAGVGQLHDALADFWGRTVNLVQEEDDGVLTRPEEPVRGVPGGDLVSLLRQSSVGVRHTDEVALGHLGRAAFDDGHSNHAGGLVDDLGLADAVATANHHGELLREDVGRDGGEGLEVDGCHDSGSVGERGKGGGRTARSHI